ncbi:MAG: hypothetical protein FD127_4161, partial [Acidimicrobiaceae bacterium]
MPIGERVEAHEPLSTIDFSGAGRGGAGGGVYDAAVTAASLADDVLAFIDELQAALTSLSSDASGHRSDLLIEASNIIAAVIDADGRQAAAELDGFLDVL